MVVFINIHNKQTPYLLHLEEKEGSLQACKVR